MSKPILIDSNILVYAINSSSPKHKTSQDYLRANAGSMVVAQQNVMEALRVLTHRKFQKPMTTDQAQKAVDAIVRHADIIAPDATAYELALMYIAEYQLTGNAIFDAYLAATALAAGASTIATDNTKDFDFYTKLTIVNPFKS